MMKNKKLTKNFFILTSQIINISIIYNLTLYFSLRSYFYSREDQLSQNNFETPILIFIILVLSLLFFNFLLKLFGLSFLLFLCFGFIVNFSVVFQIKERASINLENLNKYTFNSSLMIYNVSRNYFLN